MLTVGLTGGIASGKTTVAAMFEKRDCRVLYADKIARELMQPGQPVFEQIVRAFGPDIVAPDGALDRPRLAGMVFGDAGLRETLNAIVHPRVIQEIERRLAEIRREEPRAIVLVEAALLVESGYWTNLDKLIVTWCWPAQQIDRLLAQGMTREQARSRLNAQMSPEQKRDRADYEIDCSGSPAATETQVDPILAELRLAEQKKFAKQ
jgi:dephospho-CoA kinase